MSEPLDLVHGVLRAPRRRAADRPEIEAAVLAACLTHLRAAVALGEGNEAAAGRHEGPHVAVHPPGGGRSERTGGVALRRLGRAGVQDREVLYVLPQTLPPSAPLP